MCSTVKILEKKLFLKKKKKKKKLAAQIWVKWAKIGPETSFFASFSFP